MSKPEILDAATKRSLVAAAQKVRENAHAPYSKYFVGAALLCADGTVVRGCNMENASYGLTICAERGAFSAAVAAGHRKFRAVAIVGAGKAAPCGACRQVLVEFSPEMAVIVASPDGVIVTETTAAALLPDYFNAGSLDD